MCGEEGPNVPPGEEGMKNAQDHEAQRGRQRHQRRHHDSPEYKLTVVHDPVAQTTVKLPSNNHAVDGNPNADEAEPHEVERVEPFGSKDWYHMPEYFEYHGERNDGDEETKETTAIPRVFRDPVHNIDEVLPELGDADERQGRRWKKKSRRPQQTCDPRT